MTYEALRQQLAEAQAREEKLRGAIRDYGLTVMQTSGAWSLHDTSQLGQARDAKELEVATRNVELEVENSRLREMIGTTRDGVLLPDCQSLYCPECGGKCQPGDLCVYCWNCHNHDDGTPEGCPPLILVPNACYSSREAALQGRTNRG